jgi:metal-responsive CopG/Arc/MetJ family transcriptional regulator
MLISRPISFDAADLALFDEITGHGKRSEKIRELIKKFIKSHRKKEEQFKLGENE